MQQGGKNPSCCSLKYYGVSEMKNMYKNEREVYDEEECDEERTKHYISYSPAD